MLTPEESYAIRKFVNKSARPIFNYRRAGAIHGAENAPLVRSAKTRFKNAEQELHDMILEYIDEVYPDAQLDG